MTTSSSPEAKPTERKPRDPIGFVAAIWANRVSRPISKALRIRPRRFGSFGHGTTLLAPAHLHAPHRIHIGENSWIGAHAVLSLNEQSFGKSYEPRLTIGSRCQFGENLFISCCGEISIGDDVLGSDRVFISDTYHDFIDQDVPPVRQPLASPRPVAIGDGAFLGIGCCILPGVTVGERGYVGAGAVVTKDVPPWTMVAGNPARAIRRWDGANWVPVEQRRGD
ncbi:MAG: acyltransferase [Solirubrobacterales bacterium]